MNKIAYVAACFPEEILNKLIEINDIDDIAANVFGQKICNCCASFCCSIDVINEHKSVRFPYRKKLFMPKEDITFNNVEYHSYKYLNVIYLERKSKERKIRKLLKKLKPELVMVYSMHTPYLKPVIGLKRKFKYKTVLIVPDLPEYMMAHRKSRIAQFLKRRDMQVLYKLATEVDGFIVLTEHMLDRLPIDGKKTLVLEGIADDFPPFNVEKAERGNYILYSGVVSQSYGLPEFIDKFLKSGISEDFYVCGSGPFVKELLEISKNHSNVKYLGVVSRNKLKELQCKASLLVNPRSANDAYTQYSFPSKTIEYLASGTPVMMEKLRGIPDEYYNYIIEVENNNWVDALRLFSFGDRSHYLEKARQGAHFIKNNKTINAQAIRIKEFLEEL